VTVPGRVGAPERQQTGEPDRRAGAGHREPDAQAEGQERGQRSAEPRAGPVRDPGHITINRDRADWLRPPVLINSRWGAAERA
jgi:hypothetical protein